jgi:hypothetical protein
MKGIILVASIIAVAATIGACRREEHEPMKLGAIVMMDQVAR